MLDGFLTSAAETKESVEAMLTESLKHESSKSSLAETSVCLSGRRRRQLSQLPTDLTCITPKNNNLWNSTHFKQFCTLFIITLLGTSCCSTAVQTAQWCRGTCWTACGFDGDDKQQCTRRWDGLTLCNQTSLDQVQRLYLDQSRENRANVKATAAILSFKTTLLE